MKGGTGIARMYNLILCSEMLHSLTRSCTQGKLHKATRPTHGCPCIRYKLVCIPMATEVINSILLGIFTFGGTEILLS